LIFHGRLFLRFHLLPWGGEVIEAIRRKPWLFVMISAIAAVLGLRPGAWAPGESLPFDLPFRWVLLALVPLVGVGVFSRSLRKTAAERRLFYGARPGGDRALVWYGFFRLLLGWGGLSTVVWWALGAEGWASVVLWAISGPALCWGLARVPVKGEARARRGGLGSLSRRFSGRVAYVVSHPGFFFGPFVATLALLIWAVNGGGGFVWAEHPPIAGLLSDFLWPTAFGLVWADVSRIVPYGYFRMAQAPARRILLVLGTPVLVQTAVVLVVLTVFSASGTEAVRTWTLNLAGIAFWFFFGLRWGPATLLTFALAWAVLVIGVVADQDWWGPWAGALAVGAVVAAVGWWPSVSERAKEDLSHG